MKQEQLEKIFEIIAGEFDITVEMLMSKKKTENIIRARHTLYSTLNRLGMNKVETGRRLDRDHTSVIHGLRVYHNLYDTDDNFRYRAKRVETIVNQYVYEQTKE